MVTGLKEVNFHVDIITGASRVGKDTTSAAYLKLYPDAQVLSIDEAVRVSYWNEPELLEEARQDLLAGRDTPLTTIFRKRFVDEKYPDTKDWITHVLEERDPDGSYAYVRKAEIDLARAFWRDGKHASIPDHITRSLLASDSGRVLVQGSAILPDQIIQLPGVLSERGVEVSPAEVRAIYLGNENPGHAALMVRKVHEAIAAGHPEDNWMALRVVEGGWDNERITAFVKMSGHISQHWRTTERFGIPYFDMGEGDFAENIQRVVGYMATGEVTLLQQSVLV